MVYNLLTGNGMKYFVKLQEYEFKQGFHASLKS